MHRVEGIKQHYTEQDSGDPLILLHGNGEDTSYFEHQMESEAFNKAVLQFLMK